MTEKIYGNVMIDLETMGQGPDAAIVAIGAAAMDIEAGAIGPTWHERIDLESSVHGGGVMDASTVLWWLERDAEAQEEIFFPGRQSIDDALRSLATWFLDTCAHGVCVWGNGASFDNVILRRAFERADLAPPWAWRNDRCYRTVKALHPDVKIERSGTHHHALDDVVSQAKHLIAMLKPRGAEHEHV